METRTAECCLVTLCRGKQSEKLLPSGGTGLGHGKAQETTGEPEGNTVSRGDTEAEVWAGCGGQRRGLQVACPQDTAFPLIFPRTSS